MRGGGVYLTTMYRKYRITAVILCGLVLRHGVGDVDRVIDRVGRTHSRSSVLRADTHALKRRARVRAPRGVSPWGRLRTGFRF
eukprot:4350370-Prymnesium_polylepis.1